MATPPGNDTPVYFTLEDGKRLIAALKYFESLPTSVDDGPRKIQRGREKHFGVVTESIKAFNPSTKKFGKGEAKRHYRDPVDDILKPVVPEIIDIIKNNIVGEVAVGKNIDYEIIDGAWTLTKADCP